MELFVFGNVNDWLWVVSLCNIYSKVVNGCIFVVVGCSIVDIIRVFRKYRVGSKF